MNIDKNGCYLDIADTSLSFLYFLYENENICFEIEKVNHDNEFDKIMAYAHEE